MLFWSSDLLQIGEKILGCDSSAHSRTHSRCIVFSVIWNCTAKVACDKLASSEKSDLNFPPRFIIVPSLSRSTSFWSLSHVVHLNFSMILVWWSLHCCLSLLFFFLLGIFLPPGLSARLTAHCVFTVVEGGRSPPGCCSQPVHSNEHQPKRSPGDAE